jgi:hypothetical protein
MTDENEQPIPSRGSHGDEYELPGGPLFSERSKMAHAAFEWCRDNNASLSAPVNIVTALFSLGLVVKKPTLSDEEREAIACAAESYADNDDDEDCARVAATLRGVIERLG